MKLKSYLRGLGLGMIVTTIILVLAFQVRNKEMTDAQIKERASELGMVETSLYSNESTEKPSKTENETGSISIEPSDTIKESETVTEATSDTEKATEKATEKPTVKATEKATEKPTVKATEKATEKPTVKATEKATEKPTVKATEKQTEKATEKPTEKATEKPTTPSVIKVELDNITSADKASKILKEAGVISDVEAFNDYLSKEGLATKVGEGIFEFKPGMSFSDIADIITRRKR